MDVMLMTDEREKKGVLSSFQEHGGQAGQESERGSKGAKPRLTSAWEAPGPGRPPPEDAWAGPPHSTTTGSRGDL